FSAAANSQGDTLSQRFFSTINQFYTLDFDAGTVGTPDGGATLQLQVQVTGNSTDLNQTITPPVTSDPNAFQHFHFIFKADSTTTTLQFTNIGLGNANADEVIDNVVVAAT